MSLANLNSIRKVGNPWNFMITHNNQRDSSLEVYLEIYALQNEAFCKFSPCPRFPRSSVTSVNTVIHSGIIFVKILLNSVQYIRLFYQFFK